MAVILSIQHVSKNFGGLQAVRDVSFDVEHQSITALIGPNGSGKTTLLNIVSGFLRGDGGRILFDRQQILGTAPHEVSRLGIGRTFQIARPFGSLTALETVMVGMHSWTRAGLVPCICRLPQASSEERAMREWALELLHMVGLERDAASLAKNLPHGLQRYLELARALAGKPQLLLLDEASDGLNPRERTELVELLSRLKNSGITILLVEHNMPMVMGLSEHVVVLNHGQKIAEGSPESVAADRGVIEAYLGREFRRA